jgi:hypothetical protein
VTETEKETDSERTKMTVDSGFVKCLSTFPNGQVKVNLSELKYGNKTNVSQKL